MEVTHDMNIYGQIGWQIFDEYELETVSFDLELIESEHYIYFNVCLGKLKSPHTLMFWQNLDRLRHKIEESAYVPVYEWVRIPFSDGYMDPINTISLMFNDNGKVLVYLDRENSDSHLYLCKENEVIEKLYTNLLNWTQLYDDSLVGKEGNENFYTKENALMHMKSPILEEYIQDIKNDNYLWRHYASEPGKMCYENEE